ncbi:MAG: hypothetical protein NTY64_19940 [Deltaproteobacteria bacterium]|nr:hypothetical protein [Deltaproteobacteria bacterium]
MGRSLRSFGSLDRYDGFSLPGIKREEEGTRGGYCNLSGFPGRRDERLYPSGFYGVLKRKRYKQDGSRLGIFLGAVQRTINTIVQRSTSTEDRGGIYGIFMSGLLAGNGAGPLVGGFLAASCGLRTIFLITPGILGLALFSQI